MAGAAAPWMHIPSFTRGIFYVATGMWPIVHMRSFERATGPKPDKWLAKTTGGLIAAVGVSLIAGSFDLRSQRTLRLLGLASAAALRASDVIHAIRARAN